MYNAFQEGFSSDSIQILSMYDMQNDIIKWEIVLAETFIQPRSPSKPMAIISGACTAENQQAL